MAWYDWEVSRKQWMLSRTCQNVRIGGDQPRARFTEQLFVSTAFPAWMTHRRDMSSSHVTMRSNVVILIWWNKLIKLRLSFHNVVYTISCFIIYLYSLADEGKFAMERGHHFLMKSLREWVYPGQRLHLSSFLLILLSFVFSQFVQPVSFPLPFFLIFEWNKLNSVPLIDLSDLHSDLDAFLLGICVTRTFTLNGSESAFQLD